MYEYYVAPARFSQRRILETLWAGVAVSLCFLLFRFYVRLKIFRRLRIEDGFVLAAWLMSLTNAIIWQKNAGMLYSVIAVESGQISIPPPVYLSRSYVGLHSLFASYLLYYTALWSIKLSFLLFFRNFGNDIRRQMILWYCVLTYTLASYIICLAIIDYRCLVKAGGLAECQSGHAARYIPLSLRLATFFDTTTDGLIILISINLLWNASIEFRKKIALGAIFSLTIFNISVAIVRAVLTTRGAGLDLTWLLLWSGLEMTVAIIVACLASFRILYTRSERPRRSAFMDDRSNRDAELVVDGPSIPLNVQLVNPTSIAASKNISHKRQTSADTFEEAILPMENFYTQHRYSMFSGSRNSYEELQSPLETPVVRLHCPRSHLR